MDWRRIRHLAEFFFFRMLVCLCQIVSPRTAARVAEGLAFVIHRVVPRRWTRFEVARANLQAAFDGRLTEQQIDDTVHRMWCHLFRLVAEMMSFVDHEDYETDGLERLEAERRAEQKRLARG